MKKSISIFITILTIVVFNSTVLAEIYDGVDIPEGESAFADDVVSFVPGPNVGAPYADPLNALGEYQDIDYVSLGDIDPPNFVSLGDNGVLVVQFVDNSLTTSGDSTNDLWIFEMADVEPSNIAISVDGTNWIDVGGVAGSVAGVDIDAHVASGVELWEHYSYVRITDAGAGLSTQYEWPGVDIDAVAAISSDPPEEALPRADAGPDQQEVIEGDTVTLDGSNSEDPQYGTIISYLWEQVGGGTAVTLSGESTAVATFDVPNIAGGTEGLEFKLTVTDDKGYSDSDQITINVGAGSPTVNISPSSQTVLENISVTFGSNYSSDVVSFEWTQVSGTSVTLSGTATNRITFTSPNVGASGEALEFELKVTDDDNLKSTASCIANVSFVNLAPTANAGPNQTVGKNADIDLDGSGSSDPDAGDTIKTYSWTQTSGSAVTLSDSAVSQPTFTSPDESGALEFLLTVTDNGGLKATDAVIINVTEASNTAPSADAGGDQAVSAGASVTLDGTASADTEDNVITGFFWRQLSGTSVDLSDPSSSEPTFTAPAAGNVTLEFELTVTDSEGLKGTDSVVIAVAPVGGSGVAGGSDDSSGCFINSMTW